MEDLYGRTKTVPPQEPKFHRTNFGRVTPSDLNRSRHGYLTGRSSPPPSSELKPRQQGQPVSPELNKSRQGFSGVVAGRLTPVDPKLLRQQAGPQAAAGGLLNISSHNSSKLSSTNSGANSCHTKTTMDSSHHDLNSTQISPISATRKALLDRLNSTGTSQHNGGTRIPRERRQNLSNLLLVSADSGVREMMQSLGLLCIVSLLLALLSLVFLLKISPMPSKPELEFLTQSEYTAVYEVCLGMCCVSLCLNLTCLLVSIIQFLFTAKLVRSKQGRIRSGKYLKKASLTRVCAIVGFILSIPLILIGIVLFTFLHFNSTPAIVTSIVIGVGILFCGAAVVHNVFVWQRERTAKRADTTLLNKTASQNYISNNGLQLSHITLPHATLDLSTGANGSISAKNLELSTLV